MSYPPPQPSSSQQANNLIKRGGIVGIQRTIQDRLDTQEQNIEESFQDLSNLINKAKEMVALSVTITDKIKNQQKSSPNENDEDDKMKSFLLGMGIIDNPVSKEISGSKYYRDLALEIHRVFEKKIKEVNGLMTLSEVYCLLNRARGMAGMISPEDLQNACLQLNKLNLNLKYVIYKESNLQVLQINELIESKEKLDLIYNLIEKNNYLSADKLSKLINCNTLVATQQLLYGETIGKFCRDDTNYGLNFYINYFLEQ